MKNQERRFEIDLLRACAIASILLLHLSGYMGWAALSDLEPYLADFGIGLFCFISGYALVLGNRRITTIRQSLAFMGKRIARIYPLYMPAIALFFLLFHCLGFYHEMDMTPVAPTLITHLSGAQIAMATRLSPIPTLWFIGCIMLYYISYIPIASFSERKRGALAVGIAVFLAFGLLRYLCNVVEYRFFFYYPLFVVGILASRAGFGAAKFPKVSIAALLLVAASISGAILWPIRAELAELGKLSKMEAAFFAASHLCFVVFSVLFAGWVACAVSTRIPGKWRDRSVVVHVSIASYAVYLFHRPLLALLCGLVQNVLQLGAVGEHVVVLGFGLPSMMVACVYMQRASDKVTNWLRR